eukprot:TRINITY_DN81160_c0_g1_i1.p1 TRINITY_DN81160_c0_g1~~TRINITY_DN81160_c0_g1_i1.p1  ORF type:complete len:440 (+),score=62.36 TRINITY_DN81160_c0_g1_i1:45-1322(+)
MASHAPHSDASLPPSKPRVHLSIVKCACFEHLEGESLFTAVSAGFGRFECERLLKPSGIELMNLPRAANIEVSVMRRRFGADGERQKQQIYQGIISLAAVRAVATPVSDGSDVPHSDGEQVTVWENWLGLFGSDAGLAGQSPDRLFQRCVDMGASNARFPRLLIRLQYLPAGVVAPSRSSAGEPRRAPSERPSHLTSGSVSSTQIPPSHSPPQGGLHTSSASRSVSKSSSRGPPANAGYAASGAPTTSLALGQGPPPTSGLLSIPTTSMSLGATGNPVPSASNTLAKPSEEAVPLAQEQQELEELRARVRVLELDNQRLQQALDITDIAREKDLKDSSLGPFYKPLKSDPVDCLLAAGLLRSDLPLAPELCRIGPGNYRLGQKGRIRCFISAGKLMVQQTNGEEQASDSTELPAVELPIFLSSLR